MSYKVFLVLMTLGFSISMVNPVFSNNKLDSLYLEYQSLSNTEREARKMEVVGNLSHYWRIKNQDSSLFYNDLYLEFAEEKGEILEMVKAYRWRGSTYMFYNNLELQLESYQKALALYNHHHLDEGAHGILGDIAGAFFNAGYHEAAKEYLLKQIIVGENLSEKKSPSSGAYCNLGFTYIELAKKDSTCLDTAFFFFQSAMEIETEKGKPFYIAVVHDYMGELEFTRHNKQAAIAHYRSELKLLSNPDVLQENEGTLVFKGRAHFGLAKVFAFDQQVDSLFKHTTLAEEAWEGLEFDIQNKKLALVKMLNAETYEYIDQPRMSDLMIRESIVLAEQVSKNKELLSSIYKRIADVKSSRGDYPAAYDNLGKHLTLEQQIQQMTDNSFYLTNYSEIVNVVLESELEQKKQENIQAISVRNWSIGTAIGASTLFFLILLLFRNLKKSHRLNQQYAEELLSINQTKNKLMSVLGHDLRGPFQSIMGISQQGKREVEKGDWAKAIDSLQVIGETSREMYHLFENLLEWAKSESGNIPFHPEELDLPELIEETLVVCQGQAENKQVRIEGRLVEQKLWGDPFMVRTILRNLLSNAINFSPQGGFVNILVEQEGNRLSIWIEDEGCGMNAQEIELLMAGSNISSRNNGLGIVLCREFLAAHGSDLLLESTKGEGSRIGFQLEISKESTESAKPTKIAIDQDHSFEVKLTDVAAKIGQNYPDLFQKLQALKIYQSSKAKLILSELDAFNLVGVTAWKSQLFLAMERFDEAEFERLIGSTDQDSSQILGNPVRE